MMDVPNLAHGAFYMLGAYLALTVVQRTGSFWLALVLAPLALGVVGLALEPLLLRRLRGRHLDQVLLTIGVALVVADQIGLLWGREVRSLPFPPGLDASVPLFGGAYPVYRLFVIVVVVGGLGTLGGAVAGSVLIGPADTFGKVVFQEFALAVIFAIVAVVLLFKPTGLLGRIRLAR